VAGRPHGLPARHSRRRRAGSSTLRFPRSSASSRRRSRSSRWAMYSSSLAAGSVTGGPCPGAAAARGRARAGRAGRRGTRRASRRTNTLPLAEGRRRPCSNTRSRTQATWSWECPGVGTAAQRPELAAGHRRRARHSARAGPRTASLWSAWPWVSAMPAMPPRRSALGDDRVEVVVELGTGVDDVSRGSRERHPRVGARERHRGPGLSARIQAGRRGPRGSCGHLVARRRAARRRRGRGRPRATRTRSVS